MGMGKVATISLALILVWISERLTKARDLRRRGAMRENIKALKGFSRGFDVRGRSPLELGNRYARKSR